MSARQYQEYQEWLFALEEYIGVQKIPVSVKDYSKASLVYGFQNGLSPEEFLKDRKVALESSSTDSPPIANEEHSSVQTRNIHKERASLAVLFRAAIATVVLMIVVAIAVPRLLKRVDKAVSGPVVGMSLDQQAQARQAQEAVEALSSAVNVGITYSRYIDRLGDAQIAVDRYRNVYGCSDQFFEALTKALSCYRFAGDFWTKAVDENDEYIHYRSQNWRVFLETYKESAIVEEAVKSGQIYHAEDDFIGVHDTISAIWKRAEDLTVKARSAMAR